MYGMKPVRLCDLPPAVLQRGKDVALAREDDFAERIRIGLAAERPSATVHWVPAVAYERVMRRVKQ